MFLTKNGIRMRITFKRIENENDIRHAYSQLHCTIHLNKDDAIQIEHVDGGTAEGQSTFSGYKIR